MVNMKLGFTLLSENDSRNLLFAFVSENEILYIGGITMSFRRLLNGYRTPSATQCSCAILNTLISGHLQDGGESKYMRSQIMGSFTSVLLASTLPPFSKTA